MNPIVVVLLIIILLVICYIIYKALFPNITYLKTVTDLSKGPTTIQITDGQAKNYNVSYATWVYVNVWDSVPKVIFSRNGDVGLRLDSNKPTLYCDVAINNITPPPVGDATYNDTKNIIGANTNNGAYSSQTITVTENFPMQKWVFIIVSMDGAGFTDLYLDGKLVKSVKLANMRPHLPSEADGPIVLSGTPGWNAYISQFYRYLYTMDPQTAWNLYLYGNGIGLSQYNVDVTVSKNGIVQNDLQIF